MVHHTRNKRRNVEVPLVVGDIIIRPEPHARYLGVLMDRELRWHAHVDSVVAKSTAAVLAIGRLATGRFGLPYRFIRTLYISVIKPKIEYGVALWYTPVQPVPDSVRRRGSVGFANRLARVQRIATRLITGAFKTAPTDTLQYLAFLMPMDLQLDIAAYNATLRLASLPEQHPLHKTVLKCSSNAPRFFKSPIHKLFVAFPGLLNVETVDSTPLACTWSPPFSISIAPSREAALEQASAREASGVFTVYSDGSGEDGQVGAAAVAVGADGSELAERAYLGTLERHTVFEAELFGIVLALRIIRDAPDVVEAVICLDNQSAITRSHQPRPKQDQLVGAHYTVGANSFTVGDTLHIRLEAGAMCGPRHMQLVVRDACSIMLD